MSLHATLSHQLDVGPEADLKASTMIFGKSSIESSSMTVPSGQPVVIPVRRSCPKPSRKQGLIDPL